MATTESAKVLRRCAKCQRSPIRPHRVFKGEPYCHTCYCQDFILRSCQQCHGPVRLHKSLDSGICDACHRAQRRCMRCDKPVLKAGKLVGDAALCPSCANWASGRKRPRANHASCSLCCKHRRIAQRTDTGKPICAQCAAAGPALQQEKDAQYWARKIEQRHLAEREVLQDWTQPLFDAFVGFQRTETGDVRTYVRYAKQKQAFSGFISAFTSMDDLTAERIAERISAAQLRRWELLVRFLHSHGIPLPSASLLADKTEAARIQRLVASAKGLSLERAIAHYATAIQEQARANLRSQRGSVCAALGLAEAIGSQNPEQVHVDRYLRAKPGQRNSLSGFLHYLAANFGITLILQDRRRRRRPSRLSPQHIFSSLVGIANQTTSFPELRACAAGLICSITGAPLERVAELPLNAINAASLRLSLDFLGQSAEIPEPARSGVRRYLAELGRLHPDSAHLFPGRQKHRPITAAAIAAVLAERGLHSSVVTTFSRLQIRRAAGRRGAR